MLPVIAAASLGYIKMAGLLMILFGLPGLAYGGFVLWTGFRAYAEREDLKYDRHTRKNLSREYNRDD